MLLTLENLPEGLDALEHDREARREELVGRISLDDFRTIKSVCTCFDTRSPEEFSRGHLPFSVNVQKDQVSGSIVALKMIAQRSPMVAVLYDDGSQVLSEEEEEETGNELFKQGFPRVVNVVVEGGVEVLQQQVDVYLCDCRPVQFPSGGFSKCNNA
ncbi:hypothetical protein HDU67_009699 [Dinochytrium kinnereticum]|nr:hypothetical protein HDU67_009699 [Dinochytrium kinnereticum]